MKLKAAGVPKSPGDPAPPPAAGAAVRLRIHLARFRAGGALLLRLAPNSVSSASCQNPPTSRASCRAGQAEWTGSAYCRRAGSNSTPASRALCNPEVLPPPVPHTAAARIPLSVAAPVQIIKPAAAAGIRFIACAPVSAIVRQPAFVNCGRQPMKTVADLELAGEPDLPEHKIPAHLIPRQSGGDRSQHEHSARQRGGLLDASRWRDLPPCCGGWNSPRRRGSRWRDKGVREGAAG